MKFKKIDIKNHLGEIFTLIIVVALFSYLFVNIGIKSSLDEEFWTLFGVGFAIMVAITSIWYPTAKNKAKLKDKNFKNQRLEYSILVDRVVKTNNFKGLKDFCDYATNENKTERIKAVLVKINVDYDVYLKYAKNTDLLKEDKTLDDEQKNKLLQLIKKGVRFTIINPGKVTTAIDKIKEHYDIRSEEQKFDAITLTSKIITSILCAVMLAMIVFTGTGFTLGKLAQILSWVIMIAWNICQSINSGTKSITIYRANYYKKLRTFLEEFFASEFADKTAEWQRPNIKEEDDEPTFADAIKNKDFIKQLAKALKDQEHKDQEKQEHKEKWQF